MIELVNVLTRTGGFDEALRFARRAQQAEPDFWLSAIAAGSVFANQGNLNEAITVYQAASARYDVPLVKADLALAYHAARHDELAEKLAKETLSRDPHVAAAIIVLAEQALEARAWSTARRYTQQLVDDDVTSVSGWLLHGDALLASGDGAQAKLTYQRAIELFAQAPEAGVSIDHLSQVKTALGAGTLPENRYAQRSLPQRIKPAGAGGVRMDSDQPERTAPKPQSNDCRCASGDLICRMRCSAQ